MLNNWINSLINKRLNRKLKNTNLFSLDFDYIQSNNFYSNFPINSHSKDPTALSIVHVRRVDSDFVYYRFCHVTLVENTIEKLSYLPSEQKMELYLFQKIYPIKNSILLKATSY